MITILVYIFAYLAVGIVLGIAYAFFVGLTYPFKPVPNYQVVLIVLTWPLLIAYHVERWLTGK